MSQYKLRKNTNTERVNINYESYKLRKNTNTNYVELQTEWVNINYVRTPTQNYESILNYVRTPTQNYESI